MQRAACALACGVLLAMAACATPAPPRTFVLNGTALEAARARVRAGTDPVLQASVAAAVAAADAALAQPVVSVMQKSPTPPSGNKHDYMSLDKYYWPCNAPPPTPPPSPAAASAPPPSPPCDNSTGLPWVRHDGQTNPQMALYDHDALVNMTEAVISLGVAYYYAGNEAHAAHAAALLTAWFLDAETAMNPNLDYGHFAPGVFNGSHGAMIDTHHWPVMLDAVGLLAGSKAWGPGQETGLRAWMGQFAEWVATSPFGAAEAAETNNHGVWYDVLLSGTALYAGKAGLAAVVAHDAMAKRILVQITPAGELPAELARTKSFSYTEFATDAFLELTALAAASGVDLSHYSGHGDSLLRAALDFELPYVVGAQPWNWTQIVPFFPPNCTITAVDQCIGSFASVYRRAANLYHSTTYEKVLPKLPGVNLTANVLNLIHPPAVALL